MNLTENEKTQIRKVLEQARQRLQRTSQNALSYSMNHERNIGRDSIDESMEEELFSTEMRLHDREKFLLGKIVKQLARLDKGEIDICEDCGEQIAFRRLLARPVTTLCIDCKEQSEREEAAIAQAGRGGGFDAEDTSTTTTTAGGGDSDDFGGPERGFSGVGALDE
ncbi:MAG TPA: TraR/DksA C4-type zinc finger protein [Polyangia bacterium]